MAKEHRKGYLISLAIREMQIKTTTRYHLTPVTMTINNRTSNNKCWKGCGKKRNPHPLLVGPQISKATMENSMEVPQTLRIDLP